MGTITGDGTAQTGLGGALGYGETALPRNDDGSAQADVSAVFEDGFLLNGVTYDATEFHIATDGFVTFGQPASSLPQNPATLPMPFIAIFGADVDTRLDGEGAESGQIWLDVDTAQDCVTITWEDVGFYRRNASETNTFQMQLFDRGGGAMDVVFRYEDIDWTSGDLQGGFGGLGGDAAFIGYSESPGSNPVILGASGSEPGQIALPTTNGNTGVPGLYVFRLGISTAPIEGGDGNDVIEGTTGADRILGHAGDDRIFASSGADTIDGGKGRDTLDFSTATKGFKLNLLTPGDSTGMAAGDVLTGFEVYLGSAFNDVIVGAMLPARLEGGGGNDTLRGNSGNDSLYGGSGNDTGLGGTGNDLIDQGDGADSLSGEAGNDTLFGGTGNDTILGGNENDRIMGGDGDDKAQGGKGDDRLDLGTGDDSLLGEAGQDTLIGGTGKDTLGGGDGNDSVSGYDGGDVLNGNAGADTLYGGSPTDPNGNFLYGDAGTDLLYGGGNRDQLWGGDSADTLNGGDHKDTLNGDIGTDLLYGGGSADVLFGGDNGDTLDGGDGIDTLTGGLGADDFASSGNKHATGDWITDFSAAEKDELIFGITGAVAADFTVTEVFIAGAGQSGVAEVEIRYGRNDLLIWVLQDGADDARIIVHSGSNSFDLLA